MEFETRIITRLSQTDKDRLVEEAKINKMKLSSYIRKLLGCKK